VRRDLVANNPETVKKVMRGWFKALEFYRRHPDEAVIIMARYYNLAPAEYKLQIAGMEWLDCAKQKDGAQYKAWSDLFDTIAGLKLANGRIKRKPEASAFLDGALLENLYETGK
jgi:ABC-type nitrate/sulfonate/bicarbonate transport system substrate-binding protein